MQTSISPQLHLQADGGPVFHGAIQLFGCELAAAGIELLQLGESSMVAGINDWLEVLNAFEGAQLDYYCTSEYY